MNNNSVFTEVFDIILGNYRVDLGSILYVKQLCKESNILIKNLENIQMIQLKDDEKSNNLPIIWLAKMKWGEECDMKKTIYEIMKFRENIRKGDVELVKKVINNDLTLTDPESFRIILKLCLDFNGLTEISDMKILHELFIVIIGKCINDIYMMTDDDNYMMGMRDYHAYVTIKEKIYMKYAQYIEMTSKIIEYAIINIENMRKAKINNVDIKVFNNKRLFNILKSKNQTFIEYYRNIQDTNLKIYFKRVLTYNIKLCKGWLAAFFENQDVHIGLRNSVYIMNLKNNKKKYLNEY